MMLPPPPDRWTIDLANAERLDVANAEFALADDRLSKAPGEFDFVTSYIVLQHVPVRRG